MGWLESFYLLSLEEFGIADDEDSRRREISLFNIGDQFNSRKVGAVFTLVEKDGPEQDGPEIALRIQQTKTFESPELIINVLMSGDMLQEPRWVEHEISGDECLELPVGGQVRIAQKEFWFKEG